MKPIYSILPDIITGYEIRGKDAFLSIIVPEAATNLCTNPSFERGTSGWAAANGGTISQSVLYQYVGAYCMKIATNGFGGAGAQFDSSLTPGEVYTASMYVKGAPGGRYSLQLFDSVTGPYNRTDFIGDGEWHRYAVSATVPNVATHSILIRLNGSQNLGDYYIDGVQLEHNVYATTYFDGDTPGLVPTMSMFRWTGSPHASSSIRNGQARNGGRLLNFDAFGFAITALRGLGVTPVYNASTPSGLQGGGLYQTTVYGQRVIQVQGRFDAGSYLSLQNARKAFEDAVRYTLTVPPQQCTLVYQRNNYDTAGPNLHMLATYDGGLDGNTESFFSEVATPQFTMVNPLIAREQSAGIELITSSSIAFADYILNRTGSAATYPGEWTGMGLGLAGGRVAAMQYGPDGKLYVVGLFTSAGGVANTAYIATWDGTTWASITPTNADGSIRCLVFGPDGALYVGGTFTHVNGVAANRVAKYLSGTWTALGAGVDNSVLGMTIGPDGTLYVTGTFANAGGGAAAAVAAWDGAAWSAMGSGLSGTGQAMATGLDGLIYVTGSFTTADGNTVKHITYWDGTTFQPMGTGLAGGTPAGAGLAVGLDGRVYLAGNYTSANGVSINGIGYWDGLAWYAMGTGVSGGEGQKVFVDPLTGMVYLGGNWVTIGGLATPDSAARWNGSVWAPLDVNLPGTATLYALAVAPDGTLTLGYDQTGTATGASAINYAINEGSANTYPIIELDAAGVLYSIRNVTTGAEILFNMTLLAGERVHLDLNPAALSVTSSWRGDVSRLVLPGSQLSSFFLMPGQNIIAVFLQETSTVQNMMWWHPLYLSVDVS